MIYDRFALFTDVKGTQGDLAKADVGIVVMAEKPYAEGVGDEADPKLSATDITMIEKMRQRSQQLIVILMSGRPIEITDQLPLIDALVATWLPGTEGNSVADMLFGDDAVTGKLPFSWQRWNTQLPFNFEKLPTQGCAALRFPYGFGLDTKDPSPPILDCPGRDGRQVLKARNLKRFTRSVFYATM